MTGLLARIRAHIGREPVRLDALDKAWRRLDVPRADASDLHRCPLCPAWTADGRLCKACAPLTLSPSAGPVDVPPSRASGGLNHLPRPRWETQP